MSEINWVQTGILFLVASMFFNVMRVLTDKRIIREVGWFLLLGSTVSLLYSLVLRSLHAEYFALSNMYESMLVLILWVQIAFLVLDRWFKIPAFAWPVCLLTLIALVYDTTLPKDIHPLQAALQSYWRSIHVPVIILSYAMFTLAFISSIIFLIKSKWAPATSMPLAATGPALTPMMPNAQPEIREATTTFIASRENTSLSLTNADVYDEIAYRCTALGFPLLTIGIILGALWANEAWGNYWSWDPKESMSLVTLLGYGVYLHLRVNAEHTKQTLAWVSIAGYVLMLVTYFGVNLMGLGLHSYGKIG